MEKADRIKQQNNEDPDQEQSDLGLHSFVSPIFLILIFYGRQYFKHSVKFSEREIF